MNIDFLHNQIIRDTVTDKFIESFNENLLPFLVAEYGSSIEEIQFYEDHLASGFRIGGEFFYPLTLVCSGKPFTKWIKWQVSNYRNYDKFNPFSYKGAQLLEFAIPDVLPDGIEAVVADKPIYFDSSSAMPVFLATESEDKTFLAGKYSQSFIDALALSVTRLIEREFSISGLATSGVILEMNFAPGTFMEHIVGSTTYRRLRIKARGCNARDLWVKWTKLDGQGTFAICDIAGDDEIEFSLAEDVPGKIKEKEYRCLAVQSPDKYQNAMGRKNITEWRDTMRRVIKRGEVEKIDGEEQESSVAAVKAEEKKDAALQDAPLTDTQTLAELLMNQDVNDAADAEDEDGGEGYGEELSALLKNVIGTSSVKIEKIDDTDALSDDDSYDADELAMLDSIDESEDTADVDALFGTQENAAVSEEADGEDGEIEVVREEREPVERYSVNFEERVRAEIERKIRAELEEEIERKNREAEELRARLEEKIRQEEREKELMAEAARNAIAEQQRLQKEREENEANRKEEERIAAENARREEELRLQREREASEAAERAAALAKQREEEERAREAKQTAEQKINYVSKSVKLFFAKPIEASITSRIHEIILATIKYYHKEDVYIKIKANIPDSTTINLDFVMIPEQEIPLLVNIIKVLGKSDLGITRAILD